jgi:RES domain-containing protein
MHRLIPSKYSESGTVLEAVAEDAAMLADVARLDAATNERVQGELYGLSGISNFELVYGIPNAPIIRAAFLHPGPFGSRFNDTTRGAWYAAEKVETSIAEVAYHKSKRLAEMVVAELPEKRPDEDVSTYDDWQADFHGPFHILEPADEYAECLEAEPVPQCYVRSQLLARQLLTQKSNGVLYPSVRQKGGRCLACFRPALVYQPRRAKRYEIRLRAKRDGYETAVRVIAR